MRSYDNEQVNSVLFQGEQAGSIVDLRKSMDKESAEICGRLHEAFNLAAEEFKQLSKRYEPQFIEAMSGTELESVPLDRIAFDFTNAEKHGIVLARETEKSPIEAFLNILRTVTESGPNIDSEDRIYVEPMYGYGEGREYKPDVARAWGSQKQTETV
jgi:hypothetical protein